MLFTLDFAWAMAIRAEVQKCYLNCFSVVVFSFSFFVDVVVVVVVVAVVVVVNWCF